jgi:hypothetical protein
MAAKRDLFSFLAHFQFYKSALLSSTGNLFSEKFIMPVMKLTYFDLRARAEPARLILAQVFHFSYSAPSSF